MRWKREVLGFCVVSAAIWATAVNVAHAENSDTVQLTVREGRFYPETLNVPAGQPNTIRAAWPVMADAGPSH